MAQVSTSNPNSLPGIVTDQPEIFESDPGPNDGAAVNDIDLINEPTDENVSIIDVPMRDAFAFFAQNEEQIFKKFYVQNYGEYKIAPSKPEEETDYERYNRLVAEVNGLLNKFQEDKVVRSELIQSCSLPTKELTNNLEVLSQQLKALELAAEEGSLNPSQIDFNSSKKELKKLQLDSPHQGDNDDVSRSRPMLSSETAKDIKMRALERRLNMLETLLGHNEEREQNLFKTTKCENLMEVADTLGSWLSFFKADGIERANRELGYLTQRLEKINSEQTSDENKLEPKAKSKLDHLCSLVIATDKHRSMVPTIIHRLNAMEELQEKAAKIVTTMNYLEQVQSQIVESLQWNKDDLAGLNKMFSTNIDHIKSVSNDIDARIAAIRNKDDD